MQAYDEFQNVVITADDAWRKRNTNAEPSLASVFVLHSSTSSLRKNSSLQYNNLRSGMLKVKFRGRIISRKKLAAGAERSR